jgi:hypothetical protein
MKADARGTSAIDWQSEPKPADLRGPNGQHLYGCLVIFNTSSPHHGAKTHSLLIRDGEVISASSFEH